jgi:hypothetical protein
MKSLDALRVSVAANSAQVAVARDAFNKKVSDYDRQIADLTALLDETTAVLKALVDSFSASGGDVSE